MNPWVILGSAVASLSFILVNVMVLLYFERKILGHMQLRMGPMRTGWHGLLQSFADVLKMLTKEDVVPSAADKWLFALAPMMVMAAALTIFVTIPWQPGVVPRDLEIGVLFIPVIGSLMPIGVILGGYASNNKYSLLGALRGAAQQISYEVPMLLAVIGVVMATGSLKMTDVVANQVRWGWNIFNLHQGPQIVAFVVYMITATAEMNRTPFDLPETESELVAGFATEYSGMRWGLFFVAEYGAMVALSAVASILFLGGWDLFRLPVPGWIVMAGKTYALCFLMIWFKATFPRVRIDQLMDLGWKVLLPVALANILVTGLWQYVARGGA